MERLLPDMNMWVVAFLCIQSFVYDKALFICRGKCYPKKTLISEE